MDPYIQKYCPSAVLLLLLSLLLSSCNSQSFIGINYGQVADNLPPPEATAKLLQSTSIQKVRLYGADPAIIKALANTGIGIVIGAANGDIPALATDPNYAGNWVNSNVLSFYPASKIIVVSVGNEVVTQPDQNLVAQLVPAMQNVQNALNAASLGGKVKVSTVHSMAVLSQSEPPSLGAFGYGGTMKALLQFHSANGSPFMINPYPFFAYQSDPRPDTLAFCLFQPNAGRQDSNTGIKYMNMFDAQVDAIHSALKSMGFEDVEIVVAETGWPYKGDPNEVGPSLDNAKAYNGNLINHLRSKVGTPLMPGKSVDTYLFALYDEDLKPGPASERSFGLFKPDLSVTYDAGLSKSTQTPGPTPPTPAPSTTPAPVNPAPMTPTTPSPVNPPPMTPATRAPRNPAPTSPATPAPVNPAPMTQATPALVNPAPATPVSSVNTVPSPAAAGINGIATSCKRPPSPLVILAIILAFSLVGGHEVDSKFFGSLTMEGTIAVAVGWREYCGRVTDQKSVYS